MGNNHTHPTAADGLNLLQENLQSIHEFANLPLVSTRAMHILKMMKPLRIASVLPISSFSLILHHAMQIQDRVHPRPTSFSFLTTVSHV